MESAMAVYPNLPDENSRAEEVVIRIFTADDAATFRRLNEVWIKKYFAMEEQDHLTLADPGSSIVMKGGQIFVAVVNGCVVGCCALIAEGHGVYELAKMAVDENMQGRGIGKKLLTHTLAEAGRMGAERIVLGSNTKLQSAVHLYESFGFKHVAPEELPPSPYSRANVRMRLDLRRRG